MRRIIFTLVLVMVCLEGFGQKLTVESFKENAFDLAGSTSARLDLNGNACALIKVQVALDGVQFEGNVIGDVKRTVSEYWVYMSAGSKHLKVMHHDYLNCNVVFADYGINALRGNMTYELIVVRPEWANGVASASSQVEVPEGGNAKEQYAMGQRYYDGDGVSQSYAEAVKWFRKAAEQGYAEAQSRLGYCYDMGDGVAENKAEAVKWYQKAADQGDAKAQYNLGNCYYFGEGVAGNKAEAVKWYQKAAEQGLAKAQYNLGICYHNGEGVVENKAEAVKWFKKAAKQGVEAAIKALNELNVSY